MKVKLLKKVRKRYSITHYPDGLYLSGYFTEGPITLLWDRENNWRYRTLFHKDVKLAYSELLIELIEWIIDDNPNMGKRKNKKIRIKQLWYNN